VLIPRLGEEIMPKKMLFVAAGAALLLTASSAWNAEATTLSVVGNKPVH
jgi:hypothetical protein